MDNEEPEPAAAIISMSSSFTAISSLSPSTVATALSPSQLLVAGPSVSSIDTSEAQPLETPIQAQTVETPSSNGVASDTSDGAGEAATLNDNGKRDLDTATAKKPKKKKANTNNLWTKSTSRKGKKKSRPAFPAAAASNEETFTMTPVLRLPDRNDDNPDLPILLSRFHKAEKVELSEDRLSAGSTKGYRMVRATRGVTDGAWFFEIRVNTLGPTGHTRLGWSTEKGDLQAPVGYDGCSYAYRDIDGSKIHKALREKYGEEGYGEGDVIGFYINLPDGQDYVAKPPNLVWFKGQRYSYSMDGKEDPPKVVPGSEICFFKNGVCLGTAFTDLYGGRYYPAASMYTLPNEPNCEVTFNFGPDFAFFPQDFGGRALPRPMSEVPYENFERKSDDTAEGNGNGDGTSPT